MGGSVLTGEGVGALHKAELGDRLGGSSDLTVLMRLKTTDIVGSSKTSVQPF